MDARQLVRLFLLLWLAPSSAPQCQANGEEEIGAGALSEEDQDRDKLVQPSKVQASPGSHRNSTNLASAGRRTS